MFNPFRRQYVPSADLPSDNDLRRIAQRVDDPEVTMLVTLLRRLSEERKTTVLTERSRLKVLVAEMQGERGPNPWGEGYYDCAEDVMDLLDKGI